MATKKADNTKPSKKKKPRWSTKKKRKAAVKRKAKEAGAGKPRSPSGDKRKRVRSKSAPFEESTGGTPKSGGSVFRPSETQPKQDRGKSRGAVEAGPQSRRALSQTAGRGETFGDSTISSILKRAVQRSVEEANGHLTHGFHSYPARMHPAIANELIQAFSQEGQRVLDPFCGSGTVLVESMLAKRESIGIDLNPIALRIGEVKCSVMSDEEIQYLKKVAQGVAYRSEERVRDRVPIVAPIPKHELRWYAMHTLKELAGLQAELSLEPTTKIRRILEMIFSSIVVKVSNQAADTSTREIRKTIRKGLPTEFFLRKALELCDRLREFREALPEDFHYAVRVMGDARRARELVRGRVDLVLTSPPYGGTYDYVDHHARRYPWLKIKPKELRDHEIGARRNMSGDDARRRWDRQMLETLRSMRDVMDRQAMAILWVGDAQLGGRRVGALNQVDAIGRELNLSVLAGTSIKRVDRLGGPDRREHLICLARG